MCSGSGSESGSGSGGGNGSLIKTVLSIFKVAALDEFRLSEMGLHFFLVWAVVFFKLPFTFAAGRGMGPFARGETLGLVGTLERIARGAAEEGLAVHLAADDGRADDALGRAVAARHLVGAQDALAERDRRVPVARRQARHLGRAHQRVAVAAREPDLLEPSRKASIISEWIALFSSPKSTISYFFD